MSDPCPEIPSQLASQEKTWVILKPTQRFTLHQGKFKEQPPAHLRLQCYSPLQGRLQKVSDLQPWAGRSTTQRQHSRFQNMIDTTAQDAT